jgi:quercetin dioxygenase-like cupin family protein
MRFITVRWRPLAVGLIAIVVCGRAELVPAVRASSAGQDHTVFSAQLPNVPGKTLTAIVVEYGPGGSTPAHRHAGSVLAYVLSGQIRSENSATGPVRVYRAGETFFEPPGSTHLVSANASDTEPASLLAVFVADDHAQLTQPAH